MQNAICQITLNSITEVPIELFAGFRIFSFIKNGLPYGYVQILDRDAAIFAQFRNLSIGTPIDIEIQSTGTDEVHTYPTFYILQIENDCGLDPSKFAGTIRLWFGHAWFLYKDVKNHAYKPTNAAELIKKVLKSEDRGMEFKAEDDNFDKTDDSGEFSRFKICETDWDFINNKVLPYTTSGDQPVHFFCDDRGNFFLRSFKKMYSENSLVLYHQKEDQLAEKDNMQKISELIDKNGIDKENGHFPVSESSVRIGNTNLLKELYPSFYTENTSVGTSASGSKRVSNMVKGHIASSFGNVLPLNINYMMDLTGTSVKVVHNRQTLDSMALLFASGKHVDDMFSLELTTNFLGNKISIGHPAELFTARMDFGGTTGKKDNWINGKWLVVGLEHYTDADDYKTFLSKSYLIRPSFVGNEKQSALSPYIELMFEVS
jgi:hypothetical protein